MKRTILTFMFLFGFLTQIFAQRNQIIALFDQYQDQTGVTSIKIAKPMFSLLSQLDIQDAELESIRPMLGKIDGIRILVIDRAELSSTEGSDSKSKMSYDKLSNQIMSSIKGLKYEELITVNSNKNKVRFLASDTSGGVLDNLLLNVNADGNMVLMMLDGKISMEDVNRLASQAQETTRTETNTQTETTTSTSTITTVGEENRRVGSFSGVEVSSGVKVLLSQVAVPFVKVTADQDKLDYVKTEVRGGLLRIYVDAPKGKGTFKNLHVEVGATSDLKEIKVQAGSRLSTLNRISSEVMELSSTSGANMVVELDANRSARLQTSSGSNTTLDVYAPLVAIESTSGSNVTLRGEAEQTQFDVTSAGSVNAQDLKSRVSTVGLSSAGSLRMNADKQIKGSVSSGAKVRYRGTAKPSIDVKVNSGGSIKPF